MKLLAPLAASTLLSALTLVACGDDDAMMGDDAGIDAPDGCVDGRGVR